MTIHEYFRRVEPTGNAFLPRRQRIVYYYSSDEDIEEPNNTNIAEEEDVDEAAASEEVGEEIGSRMNSVEVENSEVFDCPTCCQPLQTPIYQCINGHVACSPCCTKLQKICSFCRSNIGDIRNRALENIIGETKIPCPNSVYGCKVTRNYGIDPSSHQRRCAFIQCLCPSPTCTYKGSYCDLKCHALDAHSWHEGKCDDKFIPFVFDQAVIFGLNLRGKKLVIFQEEKEGELIVVQASSGSNGVYVSIGCIAPRNGSNISCSLANLSDIGTLKLGGVMVEKIQKVREEEEVSKGSSYMILPTYLSSNENLKMEICIGRA